MLGPLGPYIWRHSTRLKFFADVIIWTLALPVAYAIRRDTLEMAAAQEEVLLLMALGAPLFAFMVYWFGLHRQSWSKLSRPDAEDLTMAVVLGSSIMFVEISAIQELALASTSFAAPAGIGVLPRSVPLIAGLVGIVTMGAVRLAWSRAVADGGGLEPNARRVLVVGASEAGTELVRTIRDNGGQLDPVGFVDDDETKVGTTYHGVPVLGTVDELHKHAVERRVDEVLFAIPSAEPRLRRRVQELAQRADVPVRVLPRVFDILADDSPGHFRHVVESFIAEGKPRNILVIGGAGYIGSALVGQLLDEGCHVRVLDKLIYGKEPIAEHLDHPQFELEVGDFRQIDNVVSAVQGMDAVVHLGAIVGDPASALDEEVTTEVNLMATKMIAEVVKGYGIRRFVFASTCSVYGSQPGDTKIDESSELNPVSLYADTKIASEQVLSQMADDQFRPTLLRIGTVYGFSGRTRFDLVVNLLAAKAALDGEITVYGGDQWRPFVHVHDVAKAVRLVLQAPLEDVGDEVFNVGSDEQNYQIWDVAEVIEKNVPGSEIVHVTDEHDGRNYRVSFEKIRRTLGFTPDRTLEHGVHQVVDAIERGEVTDYENPTYSNIRFLSEAGVTETVQREFEPVTDLLQDGEGVNPAAADVSDDQEGVSETEADGDDPRAPADEAT